MTYELRGMRYWAPPLVAAAFFALTGAQSQARDANELLMKSVGTTENVSPVIVEAIKHAAMDLTPEQRKLALECWKNNVCETGHGTLTVAYADGFGENVWRQVTKMEFIEQALTYPSIKKIIYTSAGGDATKAVSDMRAFIAQKVDVIVIFADAGPALLPTVKEASEAGILVVLHNGTYVGGKPGKDFVTSIAEESLCARYRFRQNGRAKLQERSNDDRRARGDAWQRPQCRLAEVLRAGNRQKQEPEASWQGRHQLDTRRFLQSDVGLSGPIRQRRCGAL